MPNIGPIELIVVLFFLVIPWAIARLGRDKGYSFAGIFILALFVWPIALLLVAYRPPREKAEAQVASDLLHEPTRPH